MSRPSEASPGLPGDDLPIPDSGAVVLRLRTRAGVDVRGHALLIGSPLDDLGGVARCLRRMAAWLAPTYALAEGPLWPTKANIQAQFERLATRRGGELSGEVEPGDQVLVYYAGHGKQGLPDPAVHDRPVTVLLPIDAREPTAAASRLIPGHALVQWLRALADACGAPPPRPVQRDRRSDEIEPSVTMIFECCHSGGITDDWPVDVAARDAIVGTMGERLKSDRVVRGTMDPLPRVVRVMASGRDEWAQGPTVHDVGLMTEALVGLLQRHPGEPWWAVIDRLQAQWSEPTQYPQIAGPDALVPLAGRRLERPGILWPCRRIDPGRWHCSLLRGAGGDPGDRVVLTASLAVTEQAQGWVERGPQSLVIREAPGSALAAHDFAWATPASVERQGIVDVWGGDPPQRAALVQRLRRCTKLARDRGPDPIGWPEPEEVRGNGAGSARVRTATLAAFEVGARGVVLRDRWGDPVARLGLSDEILWQAWLERLITLEDWLSLEHELDDWPAEAFAVRWGPWQGGQPRDWEEDVPTLSPQTPLWIELHAGITSVPAFVSLFRLRADRVVEALAPHVPGGLPVTGRYPLAGLGESGEPLRLGWPPDLDDEGPRCEQLVVMVSNRPLPLVRLQRGRVGRPTVRGGAPHERPKGSAVPTEARLAMIVRRYRLVRGEARRDDRAAPASTGCRRVEW